MSAQTIFLQPSFSVDETELLSAIAIEWHKDHLGRILAVSRNFEKLVGIPPERVIGRTTAEVLGARVDRQQQTLNRLSRQTGKPQVRIIQTQDGRQWLVCKHVTGAEIRGLAVKLVS